MKISEAAEVTGLDISTIRFYERKGLIKPSRTKGSTYRFYTDEDICRIKQIVVYRKMDLPIETIGCLLDKSVNLQTALQMQEVKLFSKREQVDSALDLCKKMIEDQVSDDFDINYYMNYVRAEEEKGKKYPTAMGILDDLAFHSIIAYPMLSPLVNHKWIRYLIGVAVFLGLVVFPVMMVVAKIIEWRIGQTGLQSFVFWLFYLFICWCAFFGIERSR